MALTDAGCKKAAPAERPYKLADAKGLYLLVKPNGSKLWRQAYRFNGKQKTLAHGSYPMVTLRDARDARDAARDHLAAGTDPARVKKSDTGGAKPTFRDLAKEHHATWKVGKNPKYADQLWRRYERDVFDAIGGRPVHEITPQEMLDMVRAIEKRGTIYSSKRLKQKCSEIFCYAIVTGRATIDPTTSLNRALKPLPKVQHMAKMTSTALPQLVSAIRGYDGDENTRDALMFTLLTATRTREVRFATWSEIEGDLWRIPSQRMKMGREHQVPLSRQVTEILERMKTRATGELIFPGAKVGEAMSENTMLFALYRMGFHRRQTVHGFRGLFSTTLNEREFNRDWIEMQLAHAGGNVVRSAYNAAQYLRQRREMMQWWADHVCAEVEDDFAALLG